VGRRREPHLRGIRDLIETATSGLGFRPAPPWWFDLNLTKIPIFTGSFDHQRSPLFFTRADIHDLD
jgi:hypothetical protein